MSVAPAAERFDLGGRIVVITGASKGIGRELTMLLAETGAVVVPTVRTDADAANLASEAQSRGLTVHPQRLDVRDVGSITEAVSGAVAAHGRIDVLVNNAGLGFARAAFDITEADWDEMMAVNLRGVFFMSQAVARNGGGGPRRPHRQHQLAGRTRRAARRRRLEQGVAVPRTQNSQYSGCGALPFSPVGIELVRIEGGAMMDGPAVVA